MTDHDIHCVLSIIAALVVGTALTPWVRSAVWRLGGGPGNGPAVAAALVTGLTALGLAVDPADRALLVAALVTGVVVGTVDIARRRLPDVVLGPSYPVVGASLTAQALVTGGNGLFRSALVASCAIAWFAAWCLIGAVGAGDVKLAGILGLFLGQSGWGSVALAVLTTAALAGVVAVGALARGGRRVAFGPVLLVGAGVGVVLS